MSANNRNSSTQTVATQTVTEYVAAQDAAEFSKKYTMGRVIGTGGYGLVRAGRRKSDGASVAVKMIEKDKIHQYKIHPERGGRRIPMEIYLMIALSDVRGVIHLIEYFEDPFSFHIIMERPHPVQDLFDYTSARRYLTEGQARLFFKQIVDIVKGVMKVGIIHRDLKDENVLVNLETNEVKLIDFGSGTFLIKDYYEEYDGTRVYSPPEWVRLSKYQGKPATIWSLGVLLYGMVFGKVPFETSEEIVAAKVVFRRNVTPECQDLIRKCLTVNPAYRLSMEEITRHPWFYIDLPSSEEYIMRGDPIPRDSPTPFSSSSDCDSDADSEG